MSDTELPRANGIAVANETPAAPAPAASEIRLSFGLFYVVLKWGHERRSHDRIEKDRRAYPVLTATHAPVLAAIWAMLFMLAYFIMKASLQALVYMFSA